MDGGRLVYLAVIPPPDRVLVYRRKNNLADCIDAWTGRVAPFFWFAKVFKLQRGFGCKSDLRHIAAKLASNRRL